MTTATTQLLETKFITETAGGLRVKNPVTLTVSPATSEFTKSPFHLKDEIKAMKGARWLGFRKDNPKKVWTVDNCFRNWFQIKYLMGQNVYEWFDRELINHEYELPLRRHQRLMADMALTYHFQVWAAIMGSGKTMAAQAVMEHSGVDTWIWAGPLKSLENIRREWDKWNFSLSHVTPKDGNSLIDAVQANEHNVYLTTYERLLKFMQNRDPDDPIVQGFICDESSRLKSPTAQRSEAAQDLADLIRAKYDTNGYVIEMSGTPSPKSPTDWWKQCEIAWPGFLKEGSKEQLEKRLAFMSLQKLPETTVNIRLGWKDDEDKCAECGKLEEDGNHHFDLDNPEANRHDFEKSFNEVSYMYKRLQGLVTVVGEDVLDLPELTYEIDHCEPTPSTIRVAKTLAASAPNVMTGITWLRELSDGFMYKDVADGLTKCKTCKGGSIPVWIDPLNPDDPIQAIDMLDEEFVNTLEESTIPCLRCGGTQQVPKTKRVSHEVPCPKEGALKNRLAQCEETGRIIIFAGFQGSVDRVRGICHKDGWDVVQCDGRGWQVTTKAKKPVQTDEPLAYWADLEHNQKVAFVAHPASGGLSLNLTEANMIVYWSSDFNPESRSQSEKRAHRMGQKKGCYIVDLIHLPSDEKVLNTLKENRRLEKMTLGEFQELFND